MSLDDLMKVAEVAKRWDVTPSRVYQLIRAGKVNAKKIGSGRSGFVVERTEVVRCEEEGVIKNQAPIAGTSYYGR